MNSKKGYDPLTINGKEVRAVIFANGEKMYLPLERKKTYTERMEEKTTLQLIGIFLNASLQIAIYKVEQMLRKG